MRIAICFNSRQYQPIFFSLSRTRYSTRSQTSPKFWRMCTIYNYDSNKKKYMKGTATSIWIIEHKRVRESEKKSCVWCFNLKPPGKRNATAIRKKRKKYSWNGECCYVANNKGMLYIHMLFESNYVLNMSKRSMGKCGYASLNMTF